MKKFTALMFSLTLILAGCAQTPSDKPISHSQNSYHVIIKGVSTNYAQDVINGLKQTDSIQSVDTVELTNNYAEYRIWSEFDSGSMYNQLVSVLDKQRKRTKVSYVANKFVIRER